MLAVSTYQPPPSSHLDLDSPEIEARRSVMFGGQLTGPQPTQSRWYIDQIEDAELTADNGSLLLIGRLMNAARRDGVFAGVLATRTGGLVRLPKRFRGDETIVHELEAGHDSIRSVYDEMLPPSELALLAADGILVGVGVAELVPVVGRKYPVLVRQDPRCLTFRYAENCWYFRTPFGEIPITPGNGRWVLHIPGGRVAPWSSAAWRAIGRAYIRKDHAQQNKDIWESKLAHPARVAQSPQGAGAEQAEAWFKKVLAWGRNTVFGVPPGYEVKLVESNGRGYDCFLKTIADCNTEMIITIAGQTVTTDGGAGFQNSDIHRSIRADLIKETADALAYTVNTQCIPVYVALEHGDDKIDTMVCTVEYDVTPPKDRNSEAQSLVTAAQAITGLDAALRPSGLQLNASLMCDRFAIPVIHPETGDVADKTADTGAPPQLTLIKGGKADDADTIAPVDSQPGDDAAQDTALNGAQVTSLVDIVRAVATGEIPRDSGVAILQRAFNLTQADAEQLMGSTGNGFTPTTAAPAPAAPPAPEAA